MTRDDAPDRIWIEEGLGCPYFYDASELAEAGGPLIEYIRADLATPAPVVPAEGLARASVTNASAGWTLDFEMLQEFRADAGDWGYSLDLEAVEQIALAVEARLRSAPPVGARVTGWQQIETAPHEELVVLGWQEDGAWKQEIALASAGERFPNGYSNMWTHGRATHWMPLPEPPAALLPAGEGE